MPDLDAGWTADLSVSAVGDVVTVSLPSLGTERVIRRLLTNPGAYVWHPEYGAGLAQFVGQPVDVASIQALVRSQMALEPAVAVEPQPVVTVRSDPGGTLFLQVRYADAETAALQSLNIQVPG